MKTKILILSILTVLSFSLMSQTLNDTNIIFVDFDPDIVLIGNINVRDSLRIDINQDGILDFKFYYQPYSGGLYPYVGSMNNNCRYNHFNVANNDSLNDPSIIWLLGNNFWGFSDVMWGIKIISGSDDYYGWIHAICGSSNAFLMTIDKHAFCKIPNYPFHLGQTTLTSVSQNFYIPDSITVHLENSGNTVIVQSGKIIKRVILTSINGIEVATQSNINSYSTRINVTGIARGAYIVQVQFKDLTISTKQIVL